jgi:hypothetical protein
VTTAPTGTIYGLVDPRTGDVKYVGQTAKPIEVRLAGHLAAPAPLVRAWIEELSFEGRVPQIAPIREDVPVDQLEEAEKEEIRAHAERGDILNVLGNQPGNTKRRKASREEAKRRQAEEDAMNLAWRQASWRQVADQLRDATGGPISPADVPIREIPAAVWEVYQAYRDADRRFTENIAVGLQLRPGTGVTVAGDGPAAEEKRAALQQLHTLQPGLERYLRTYCGAFSLVDDGDRWGSNEGVSDRGLQAYRNEFCDPSHMARYLSLIPWAARALDPWVELATKAGIDVKGVEFTEWVSDDQATREAIDLYRSTSPGWLGVFRQEWDQDIATYALALGAAHIPGFTVPHLLEKALGEGLTKLARDRQATREMCLLLQRINPKALDAVYGRDELTESDEALGLPPGTSAKVVRQVYGRDLRDPGDRTAKLLQRHTGEFDIVAVPDYGEWTGIHIPALRVVAASFCMAGLFSDAREDGDGELLDRVKSTWKPTRHGLQRIGELEGRLRSRAA